MQQLSRTCLVADHYFKEIEYVCLYPQCQLSRFLCSKCSLGSSHKHNQQDNSHIVDKWDLCEIVKSKMNHLIDKQQLNKCNIQRIIVLLKKLMQEILNFMKNVQNISQQVEQGKFQNYNINQFNKWLLDIQKNGFNQIADQSLNKLINIAEQQQGLDVNKLLENQADSIIQNAMKIKEWYLSQVVNNYKSLSQKLKDVKQSIQQLVDKKNFTGAISNDLKYIASGRDDGLIKILKLIKLNDSVFSSQFTQDSTFFQAGSYRYLYQFDVNTQFKQIYKQEIHTSWIYNIYCISNKTILTSSFDNTIIKTDVNKKQQLLKIQAHNDSIYGLDYNKIQNIIASGSDDNSIQLWDGNDGLLIIEKLNAHNNLKYIRQVQFISNKNQLISLDSLVIWNIHDQAQQLEQLQLIKNSGYNISLVSQYQYSRGKVHKGSFSYGGCCQII